MWELSFAVRTVSVRCWGLLERNLCYSEHFAAVRACYVQLLWVSGAAFKDIISSIMVLMVPGSCQVLWYLRYQAHVKYYGTRGTRLVTVGFPRPCSGSRTGVGFPESAVPNRSHARPQTATSPLRRFPSITRLSRQISADTVTEESHPPPSGTKYGRPDA